MYTVAVVVCRALTILFRLVFSLVIMRLVFSLADGKDSLVLNFVKKLLYAVTEPVLAPVRSIQDRILGRFAIQYDFSYLAVIAVISALLIIF